MRRILSIACTILACACCASAPKVYPWNAQPLSVDGWYATEYAEVVACARRLKEYSGIRFDQIQWLITPKGAINDGTIIGLTSFPNRIYLDAGYAQNVDVVSHEMAHVALKSPYNEHDNPAFLLCSGARP